MENRVEKAKRLFIEGYNCAQAVVAAYSDLYGLDEEVALALSCGFGAGLGRNREVCGAVSGMAIIAGLENGTVDGKDIVGKKANYDLINKMIEEFKKTNNSIICRELLGQKKTKNVDTTPEARTDEYYKKRPCLKQVEDCARIIEEIVIANSKKINRKVLFVKVTTPEQVTKVVELADKIWKECYKGVLSDEEIETRIDTYQADNVITKKMINEGYNYYLINNGSSVIGYVSFSRDKEEIKVNELYILKEYRDKGYYELAKEKIIKEYSNN